VGFLRATDLYLIASTLAELACCRLCSAIASAIPALIASDFAISKAIQGYVARGSFFLPPSKRTKIVDNFS